MQPVRQMLLFLFAALVFVAGCGDDGPQLAPVTGTIKFAGEPLAGARVEFQPNEGNPSSAITDEQGRYELLYALGRRGAVVGTHTVRITTAATHTDAQGEEVHVDERLPAEYHAESKLIREVKPGTNTLDFDL